VSTYPELAFPGKKGGPERIDRRARIVCTTVIPGRTDAIRVVNSYVRLTLLALSLLVVGLPLWLFVFVPERLSLATFADPGFWIAVAVGLISILFGFWIGNRSDHT
jgi:hypothetical protein